MSNNNSSAQPSQEANGPVVGRVGTKCAHHPVKFSWQCWPGGGTRTPAFQRQAMPKPILTVGKESVSP